MYQTKIIIIFKYNLRYNICLYDKWYRSMVRYVIHFHKVCYSTFVQQDNYREHNLEVELDPFTNIKLRIQEDNKSIRNVCAKYLDSKHPWLPIKPKPTVQYYFLDKTKKLGWCVNAKVLIFSYMFINANLI